MNRYQCDPSTLRQWRDFPAARVFLVVIVIFHGLIAADVARRYSATHDEYWHIPVGLLNAQTARFDYDNLNPPVLRVITALPLVLTGTSTGEVPDGADPREIGDAFLRAHPDDYDHKVFLARLPIVLLSMLTAWCLATWSLQESGPVAAMLSAGLWCFSPLVLANASLATSDLGAASCMLLSVWQAKRFADDPGWIRAVLLGVVLGVGPVVKYTCVLCVPLALFTWLVVRTGNKQRQRVPFFICVAQWLLAAVLCVLVMNAAYLFQGTLRPLNGWNFQSGLLQAIANLLQPVSAVRVPFPADFLAGIDHQQAILEAAHPVYLNGNWLVGGDTAYYFYAALYKLTHAEHAGILIAGMLLLVDRKSWRQRMMLGAPIGLLVFLASRSSMQLGIRYVFPVFPFVLMLIGDVANRRSRRLGLVIAVLLVAGNVAALRHHPDHLAYFNEFAGGPENGSAYLLDSNIDWGQDLKLVRDFMQREELEEINLVYFGMIPPSDYGIAFRVPAENQIPKTPGWYAVSENFAMGRPHTLRLPDGSVKQSGIGAYSFFSRFMHAEQRLGKSIRLYRVAR